MPELPGANASVGDATQPPLVCAMGPTSAALYRRYMPRGSIYDILHKTPKMAVDYRRKCVPARHSGRAERALPARRYLPGFEAKGQHSVYRGPWAGDAQTEIIKLILAVCSNI